jgi:hypothetical protein
MVCSPVRRETISERKVLVDTKPDIALQTRPHTLHIKSLPARGYLALIDLADTSRNFSRTGQWPYLYYNKMEQKFCL